MGKAGSGKSTLAKMIQQTLATQNKDSEHQGRFLGSLSSDKAVVVDFFYSARKGEVATSHELMLRSLLYQILEQDPASYVYFRQPFRNLRDRSSTGATWTYSGLKDVFQNIATSQKRATKKLYCIIDAMDESENETNSGVPRFEVLRWLYDTAVLAYPGLKCIITSRPANDIERAFRDAFIIILENHNNEDISKVVQAGVKNLSSLSSEIITQKTSRGMGLESADPDFSFVRTHLLENADGVILWVELVLRELYKHVERGYFTPNEIRLKVQSLPTKLIPLYEDIMNRLRQSSSRESVLTARLILMWICFAHRAMTVSELRDIVAVGHLEELPSGKFLDLEGNRLKLQAGNWSPIRRQMLDLCGGLLDVVESGNLDPVEPSGQKHYQYIVRPSDVVQFFHQTVKDFLVNNDAARPFDLDRELANKTISLSCMTYLMSSLPLRKLESKPAATWVDNDYLALIDRLKDRPLLVYVLDNPSQLPRTGHEAFSTYIMNLSSNHSLHGWCLLADWVRRAGFSKRKTGNAERVFQATCFSHAVALADTGVVSFLLRIVRFSTEQVLGELKVAVSMGNTAISAMLLDNLSSYSLDSADLKTEALLVALHQAIIHKNMAVISRIMDRGLAQVTRDIDGTTALHLAAALGHTDIVEVLLKAGADPMARDKNRMTAFDLAVDANHKVTARQILQCGYPMPDIFEAARRRKPYLAQLILETHEQPAMLSIMTEPSLDDPSMRRKPLHVAVMENNIETAQALLDAGANVEATGPFGKPTLCFAIRYSSDETVEFLCKMAKVNARDENGRTALIEAAELSRHTCVRTLLEFGADVNLQDNYGRTALHEAVCLKDSQVLDSLIAWKIDSRKRNFWGATALDIAARDRSVDFIRKLEAYDRCTTQPINL